MKIDIVTIFPDMVREVLRAGIVGRAIEHGLVDACVHDLRVFTDDRHRTVDDIPYGGGPGMVLKAEPLFRAVDAIEAGRGRPSAVILLSPQGKPFTHAEAERLSGMTHLVFLCGRYEGIDERVRDRVATEELSIGDYVLSGGELPALVVVDAVTRLLPGAVGDTGSVEADSFVRGLLDYPHYTRPSELRGMKVPDVLLSGHHGEIDQWRRREAIRRTLERRPELLERATLDTDEQKMLRELKQREEGVSHERN